MFNIANFIFSAPLCEEEVGRRSGVESVARKRYGRKVEGELDRKGKVRRNNRKRKS